MQRGGQQGFALDVAVVFERLDRPRMKVSEAVALEGFLLRGEDTVEGEFRSRLAEDSQAWQGVVEPVEIIPRGRARDHRPGTLEPVQRRQAPGPEDRQFRRLQVKSGPALEDELIGIRHHRAIIPEAAPLGRMAASLPVALASAASTNLPIRLPRHPQAGREVGSGRYLMHHRVPVLRGRLRPIPVSGHDFAGRSQATGGSRQLAKHGEHGPAGPLQSPLHRLRKRPSPLQQPVKQNRGMRSSLRERIPRHLHGRQERFHVFHQPGHGGDIVQWRNYIQGNRRQLHEKRGHPPAVVQVPEIQSRWVMMMCSL